MFRKPVPSFFFVCGWCVFDVPGLRRFGFPILLHIIIKGNLVGKSPIYELFMYHDK